MKARTKATQQLFRPANLPADAHLQIDVTDTLNKFILTISERRTRADGSVYHSWPGYHCRDWVKRIPERKELSGGNFPQFEVAATAYTVEIIRALWKPEQIEFTEAASTVFRLITANYAAQDRIAEAYAAFKADRTMPEGFEPELHPDRPLAQYQQFGLWASMQTDGYGLFMEQGTGKTAVVIARVMNEAKRFREGYMDHSGLAVSREKLQAKYSALIRQELEELEAEFEPSVKSERERRVHEAKQEAERQHASLHYEGAVAVVVDKAREVVRQAEEWLRKRIAEIDLDMVEYRERRRAEIDTAKATRKAELEAECVLKVNALKPKHVPGQKRPYRVIVVVPKNVRLNWYNEFCNFATRPGNVTILRGGEVQRVGFLTEAFQFDDDTEYTVVICSYEAMWKSWNVLQTIDWDLAVLDEGHYIKWHKTKRAQFSKKLRERSRNRMLLTGTPVTNTPLDLYTQLEFLGEGYSGFTSWESFREFYGVYETTGSGYDKLVGMQNLPFMQERLTETSFMIRKEEALPDLPEKVYDIAEVEMTREQADIYDQIATQLAVEIEADLEQGSDNRQLMIQNILVKLLRLAQITSGFVSWDPVHDPDSGEMVTPRKIEHFTPSPKIETLLEILKDKGPNDKTIVWACFVPDIKAISAALTAAGIDHVTYFGGTSDAGRADAEQRFNHDPNCKVFIGHPAAGGVGLNLLGYPPGNGDDYTTNCNHVIYFSQGWSMVHRAQSEDRAHRRGTRTNVRITDLTVPNTIDETIRVRVMEKRAVALQVSDVREILTSILKGIGRHD